MHVWTAITRTILVVVAAAIALPLDVSSFRLSQSALADDGGGSGSGSSGGDGGGPGDDWLPFNKRGWRQAKHRHCTCSILIFCNCTIANRHSAGSRHARPEIVISGLDDAAVEDLLRRGFAIRGQRQSALLRAPIVRLAVPQGRSVSQGLRLVRSLIPAAALAAPNDTYRKLLTAYRPTGQSCGRSCETFVVTQWTDAVGTCSANTRIGIVDTGIDPKHPSLIGASLNVRSVRSADREASDTEHGTAVASLLVGQRDGLVAGLVPKAHLFAADAFFGIGGSSAADAFDLITALDWLSEEDVRLVNLSLSGPDNALLKSAIGMAQQRGMRLVAAAGKPGENARSGYPARYPGVIAVSAVDTRLRASRHSIRGRHITFAAPGVGVLVAAPGDSVRLAEGTSFAAPFVTAAFAIADRNAGLDDVLDPVERLAISARDLGAPGRDPIFGWGLIQFSGLSRCDS